VTVRDHQRSRVYAWEDRHVAVHNLGEIGFGAAQGVVDAIWSEMGLLYPPRVKPLPSGVRSCLADADRLTLRLPSSTPSWVLLHEIAHAMASDHDGSSDGHGSVFMALYLRLLGRYLQFDEGALRASATGNGLRVATEARPIFVTP
jgi:hypothetical protein